MMESACLLFVGDPGPHALTQLRVLEENGIAARRCDVGCSTQDIVAAKPGAVVFGPDVEELHQRIVALREQRALQNVPFLARVASPSPKALQNAFHAGCNDVLIDGRLNQFRALLASVWHGGAWSGMRAPAGLVVVAHRERLRRLRLAQVLRKNGFDTYFAASVEELARALDKTEPRAVIAADELEGGSVFPLVERVEIPWVVVSHSENVGLELNAGTVRVLDADSDAESLTFILNDLLAPEQKSARRTPRLLYGTPVSFWPEQADREDAFAGFSFNVNIGGLFVRTLTPPPMQTRLYVAFSPPYGMGQVILAAQVVWVKRWGQAGSSATPEGMGVQFLDSALADVAGFEAGYEHLRAVREQKPSRYVSQAPAATPSLQPGAPA